MKWRHLGEFVYEGNESWGVTHGFVHVQPCEDLVQVPAAMKLGCGAMFLAGLPPGRMPLDAAGEAMITTSPATKAQTTPSRRATSGALS